MSAETANPNAWMHVSKIKADRTIAVHRRVTGLALGKICVTELPDDPNVVKVCMGGATTNMTRDDLHWMATQLIDFCEGKA